MDHIETDTISSCKGLIPEEYHKEINCCYIFLKGELEMKCVKRADCVICTKQGYLLEFKELKLVNSCKIANKEAEKVYPLCAYFCDNICIYYIVQLPNKLEFVSPRPNFKSFHIETDVMDWEIEETVIGIPSIRVAHSDGIWQTLNIIESERKLCTEGMLNVQALLKDQFNKECNRLNLLEEMLQEKQASLPKLPKEVKGVYRECTSGSPKLEDYKYIVHHGRIVVVVRVQHFGRHPVTKIRLSILKDPWLRLEQWGPTVPIKQGTVTSLVGKLTTKNTFPNVITDLHVFYKFGENGGKIGLPPIIIKPWKVFKNQFALSTLGTQELYQVLWHCSGKSEHFQMTCLEILRAPCWKFLEKKLFSMTVLMRETKDIKILRYEGPVVELCACYLILQPTNFSIFVCCRDQAQLNIMETLINDVLPDKCKLTPLHKIQNKIEDSPGPDTITAAIEHELDWVRKNYRLLTKPIPREKYEAFYDEMMKRSIHTEILLLNPKFANNN